MLPFVCDTPLVLYNGPLHGWRAIWLKDETQQQTRAFKFRGNVAKLATLPPGSRVVTASTGNHGCGLAIAAQLFGMRACVYVPHTTPRSKQGRIVAAGAELVLVHGDYDQCTAAALQAAAADGAVYVSSFDDHEIIDGHRSLCVEVDAVGIEFETVFVPVGGGGLLAACFKHWGWTKHIVGVESMTAPAMYESLRAGHRVMLPEANGPAEGLLVRQIGVIAFDIARRYQPPIVLVDGATIEQAIGSLWLYNGIRAEGAGAAALAAALATPMPRKQCLCIVSGGNIDEPLFQATIERHRTKAR